MKHYKYLQQQKNIKESIRRDPFQLIQENSKDGSVILNHTFRSNKNEATEESIALKQKWMYQASPKYNTGNIDLFKDSRSNSSKEVLSEVQEALGEKDETSIREESKDDKEIIQEEIKQSLKSLNSRIDTIQNILSTQPVEDIIPEVTEEKSKSTSQCLLAYQPSFKESSIEQ